MKQPTKREIDVLNELITGASNKEIARRLGVSSFTVREHLRHLEEKLGCRNRVDIAAKWANHLASKRASPATGIDANGNDSGNWPGPDSRWP